jgi:hypothetical protein
VVAEPKPAPPTVNPELERARDTYRYPKARHAMHLFIPRVKPDGVVEGKLTITELKDGVKISLDVDDDGIGVKSLNLSLSEATKLADMLNRVRRHVVERQRNGYQP